VRYEIEGLILAIWFLTSAERGYGGQVSNSHLALFLSYQCGIARLDHHSLNTTSSPTQCVANWSNLSKNVSIITYSATRCGTSRGVFGGVAPLTGDRAGIPWRGYGHRAGE